MTNQYSNDDLVIKEKLFLKPPRQDPVTLEELNLDLLFQQNQLIQIMANPNPS